MNKKGSFGLDIVLILFIGLLVFAIVAMFVGHRVWSEVNDGLQSMPNIQEQTKATEVLNLGTKLVNGFDFLFIFLLIALFMVMIISVFFIDTNPMFFAIALILFLSAVIVLAAIFSDVFGMISDQTEFANETATYPMTTWTFSNFVLIVGVMGFVTLIVLYAKIKLT